MKHELLHAFGLVAAVLLALGASPANADTTAVGPYYATPSWDQQLPASTRFIVLSNWGNAAVLDRETGLVWEKSPSQTGCSSSDDPLIRLPQFYVAGCCLHRKTGGRLGWRVPTIDELLTLVDPTVPYPPNPRLPAGHPFTNIQPDLYWTATTTQLDSRSAYAVDFGALGGSDQRSTADFVGLGWCVRGNSHAHVY